LIIGGRRFLISLYSLNPSFHIWFVRASSSRRQDYKVN
jgi:hypothetical protein